MFVYKVKGGEQRDSLTGDLREMRTSHTREAAYSNVTFTVTATRYFRAIK